MNGNLTSIELYNTDHVIMLRPNCREFLRFDNGEIIIYEDKETAQKDALTVNGTAVSCKAIFKYMQDMLIENIRTHRIRNTK